MLHDAGVPDDAYVNVYAASRQIPAILADPRVQGVSLTGSEAGRNLKKAAWSWAGPTR